MLKISAKKPTMKQGSGRKSTAKLKKSQPAKLTVKSTSTNNTKKFKLASPNNKLQAVPSKKNKPLATGIRSKVSLAQTGAQKQRRRLKKSCSRLGSPFEIENKVAKTNHQSRRGSFFNCDQTLTEILHVFNSIDV